MDNGDCFVAYADAAKYREELKRHSVRDADRAPIFGEIMHKMALAVKPIAASWIIKLVQVATPPVAARLKE